MTPLDVKEKGGKDSGNKGIAPLFPLKRPVW